jgi:hypothetical protein
VKTSKLEQRKGWKRECECITLPVSKMLDCVCSPVSKEQSTEQFGLIATFLIYILIGTSYHD